MRSTALCLALCLLLCACGAPPPPAPASDPATRTKLTSGDLVGFTGEHGTHVWLGIPYAAPPVGPLRWRAPAEVKPWAGTREALGFGARCPQLASRLDSVYDAGTVV